MSFSSPKIYSNLLLIVILTIIPESIFAIDSLYFSKERGFYSGPIDLVISSKTQNAHIYYTTDFSDPRNSATSINTVSPASINIDPNSTAWRYKTPCIVIRAYAADSFDTTQVITHTYIFLEKVKTQTNPGSNWPHTRINGQVIDNEIDTRIINDPEYKGLIEDAFKAIPSISLVTDVENLFDPARGIYVNAIQYGDEWERPASMEIIYPDGREGFQVNAGIRIRGGWSRDRENPKHAFRIFFRDEYGAAKLKYPMFEDEGVDEFDNMDLRTSQNDSWSFLGSEYNIMNRDVFSRDTQRELGHPYTRSRYYHLYLNGMYWGLFQSQERSEASYAESYLGGDKENYDVIKPLGRYRPNAYTNFATDGNMDAYRRLWEIARIGFRDNSAYYRVQGKNLDGTYNPGFEKLLDVDNLIDYMLVIYYTGNNDAPVTRNGEAVNNYFAIYDRTNPDGFKYFLHDAEHTLVPYYYYHDVTFLTLTGRSFEDFNPRWLHQQLAVNKEYLQRFIDRAYKHFFNGGVLTYAKNIERFSERASQIELAIIAESARWGDSKTYWPRTKNDDWLPAIKDLIETYFPMRTNLVISQLRQMFWYTAIDPPRFFRAEQHFNPGIHSFPQGSILTIRNMNDENIPVYFTTDGNDPRLKGGNIYSGSSEFTNSVSLAMDSSVVIKARAFDNFSWSALAEIILIADNDNKELRISEINYNPIEEMGIDGDRFEFLELFNSGRSPIQLENYQFNSGIEYRFAEASCILPGEYIVLASDSYYFRKRYGFNPFGQYKGQLSNGGETVTLTDSKGETLISITYDDENGWPEECDGKGYSLVLRNSMDSSNISNSSAWRASYNINGSPGMEDTITGNNKQETVPNEYFLYNNYPNPFNNSTTIEYDIPFQSSVGLKIYNLLGQIIITLVKQEQNPGIHRTVWNAGNNPSGIYIVELNVVSTFNEKKYYSTKKMLLLK